MGSVLCLSACLISESVVSIRGMWMIIRDEFREGMFLGFNDSEHAI